MRQLIELQDGDRVVPAPRVIPNPEFRKMLVIATRKQELFLYSPEHGDLVRALLRPDGPKGWHESSSKV